MVELGEGVANDSEVHAALLLYKAKALHKLGLGHAARDLLSSTIRKKKDRSKDLLLALQYERALIYESMGNSRRSRAEFEKIYAESPAYEDVAQRLGL